jgi:ATP-dependent helicase YprA (DUF1998 family)
LAAGAQRHFALSPDELGVLWEGAHTVQRDDKSVQQAEIPHLDYSIGGSGYLRKLFHKLDDVTRQALNHLLHENCETACYRCLKTYQNQGNHAMLHWPVIISALEGLAGEASRGGFIRLSRTEER